MAEQTSTMGAHGLSQRILDVVIVTPERTVREASAQFVALPLYDGELGVLPGHSPMIGRLGFGELRLVEGGKTERYYIDGGFVQITGGVVSVLTNRALPAEQVRAEQATEQLQAALRRPTNTPELEAIRERAQLQARAQLRIARHTTGA